MKKTTIKEYNRKMDKLIKMGKPVVDTLIDLLEEAKNYKIVQKKRKT